MRIPLNEAQQRKINKLVVAVVEENIDLTHALVASPIEAEAYFWQFVRNYKGSISFIPENFLTNSEFYVLDDGTGYAIDVPLWVSEKVQSDVYLMLRLLTNSHSDIVIEYLKVR